MNRRQFVLGGGVMALSSTGARAAKKQVEQRPNILLIVADELGAWTLGAYGNTEFKTPNIDVLARSGMRFVNSFACSPVASPSLATLLTGRLPSQHGILDSAVTEPSGQTAPAPSLDREVLLSDILSGAGYNCGYVGKWDLGKDEQPKHSFDYTSTISPKSARNQDPDVSTNGNVSTEKGFLSEVLAQKACDYIGGQPAGKPFFLTISFCSPSISYEGLPQKYRDFYTNTDFHTVGFETPSPRASRGKSMMQSMTASIRGYAAAASAIDDQIPALLRKLSDKNLRTNTLVIVTSSNGCLLGRHGLWGDGLASDPPNMYDEVMAVPMIWHWLGKIPTEAIVPEIVSSYDFLPSICEITGAPLPAGRNLVGRSYAKLATQDPLPKKEPWKNLSYGQFRNIEVLRDHRFKLVLRSAGSGQSEFYYLEKDPRERVNQYDNPQYITVRDEMIAKLPGWRSRTRS